MNQDLKELLGAAEQVIYEEQHKEQGVTVGTLRKLTEAVARPFPETAERITVTTITVTIVDKRNRKEFSKTNQAKGMYNAIREAADYQVGSKVNVECSVTMDGPWNMDLELLEDPE